MRVHIGDLLSVITGIMLAPGGFGDVHRLLDHLTGDTLFTHQLPRAFDFVKPIMAERYPALAAIDVPKDVGARFKEWLASTVATHGEFFDVDPIAGNQWERRDPISEAQAMFGDRMLVVNAP